MEQFSKKRRRTEPASVIFCELDNDFRQAYFMSGEIRINLKIYGGNNVIVSFCKNSFFAIKKFIVEEQNVINSYADRN